MGHSKLVESHSVVRRRVREPKLVPIATGRDDAELAPGMRNRCLERLG
jgi:hypothetical protein